MQGAEARQQYLNRPIHAASRHFPFSINFHGVSAGNPANHQLFTKDWAGSPETPLNMNESGRKNAISGLKAVNPGFPRKSVDTKGGGSLFISVIARWSSW
jgi:hypothetical protein